MKYFQDIEIINYHDVGFSFVMSKVFTGIHHAINDSSKKRVNPIGLTFPDYKHGGEKNSGRLGVFIRVFAKTQVDLIQLNLKELLKRFRENVNLTDIKPVPKGVKSFAITSSERAPINKESLIRRCVKRKNVSYDEAREMYKGYSQELLNLPYIKHKSLSTGQEFSIFIKVEMCGELIDEGFNGFGLSKKSSLPCF